MADIGLSAFSLFFMQSESFLSYQRSLEDERKTSNCHTLFGMAKIPTDNHIRSMLDPVHPSHLQSSFDQVVAILRERGGVKEFERLGGRALIALDGTEYFCSQRGSRTDTAGSRRRRCATARTPSSSIGSASPSATPRARRPTTAPSSPRSRSRAKTSLRSPPAHERGGKSRTKASTSSKTTAIISNIISATASRTSPCCSPR